MKVTLCGSARFESYFKIWNELLSLAGHVVYTLSVYPSDKWGKKNWYNAQDKITLDKIHKKKIDFSDAIFVLNPYAYLGESTLSEINHAKRESKQVYILQSWGAGCGIGLNSKDSYRYAKIGYGIPTQYTSPIDTTGFLHPWSDQFFGAGASELRSRIVDQYQKFENHDRELRATIAMSGGTHETIP